MKTVWIIDGAYLFSFGKAHPFDYLKLKNEIVRLNGGPLHEGYYLNSTPDPAGDARNPFHTWMKSAAPKGPKLRVQLYGLKDVHSACPNCRHEFDRHVQKGVDVGIATLIVKLAAQNVYERLILSAGDGDFEDAISYVKSELHKEVWICGSQHNLSADLQSYADQVLWLEDMLDDIGT
jgi:uncharacterized LabA/DUF88 family protein